jgi:hypothetical protein
MRSRHGLEDAMIRSERGGVLKTALIVVAVLVVLTAVFGGGGKSKESKTVSSPDAEPPAAEQTAEQAPAPAEEAPAPAEEPPAEPEPDFSALSVGQAVTYKNGLSVAVTGVTRGLANYDGGLITGITVTYTNTGSDTQSFNVYDWTGEDANGAQRNMAYYSEATNELNSGKLSPGGSVTGNVYFDGDIVRAIYTENIFLDDSVAAWIL